MSHATPGMSLPSDELVDASGGSAAHLVPRPLTEEERKAAWTAANFYNATSSQEQPVALWVLGPSSVGKSTLTAQIAPKFGIPKLAEGADNRSQLDAVIIDGEFVRDAHDVWQRWVKLPDWRSAYPALKSVINKEKDSMCTEAASLRKHLVIPQTMLNLRKGLTEVDELAIHGYINHVVAVVAPLEECQRRGRCREEETGKRYQPLEYEKSIAAIPQVISRSNGRYELVKAIERDDPKSGMDFHTLAEGHGGNFVSADGRTSKACEGELGSISDIISVAIDRSRLSCRRLTIEPSSVAPEFLPELLSTQSFPLSRPCDVRQFTAEEREAAWSGSNLYRCDAGHARPIALWILGPGAVGKSTLTVKMAPEFDIPTMGEPIRDGQDPRCQLNAVIVDGDLLRTAYAVYHSWANSAEKQYAYRAVKSVINKEKGRLVTETISQRKHVVIPQRMLDLNKGLTEVEELTRHGFINHVVAVVASVEECQTRAERHHDTTGKYEEAVFEANFTQSISAIPPMVAACNGRYQVIHATEANGMLECKFIAGDACGLNDSDESVKTRSKAYYEYLRAAIDCAISE